jgi:hypothetical protein
MLKELNKLWMQARRRAAAWRRWARKLPHNRVRRPRLRDARGRPIGYGPPQPLPEPPLSACFCQKVTLPSGQIEIVLSDAGIEAAYRLARHPKSTAEEVPPLPIADKEIRRMYEQWC